MHVQYAYVRYSLSIIIILLELYPLPPSVYRSPALPYTTETRGSSISYSTMEQDRYCVDTKNNSSKI